jgi:hypothetical protein
MLYTICKNGGYETDYFLSHNVNAHEYINVVTGDFRHPINGASFSKN